MNKHMYILADGGRIAASSVPIVLVSQGFFPYIRTDI